MSVKRASTVLVKFPISACSQKLAKRGIKKPYTTQDSSWWNPLSRRTYLLAHCSSFFSLLAEVSHDKTSWNERRETSADFRRVSYHACPRVSLTTNLSACSNFKWTNQSWRWNDLASGHCRGPHYKSLRKAEKANFKANFSFFTSLSTGKAHVFGMTFIGLYGTVGFIAIRDSLFFLRRKRFVEWRLASEWFPC